MIGGRTSTAGSHISAQGSASIAAQSLTLEADNAPNQPAIAGQATRIQSRKGRASETIEGTKGRWRARPGPVVKFSST